MINKILIDRKGKRYYWEIGDLNTHLGIIKESKIKKARLEVKSSLGKKFMVTDANFLDNIKNIKRGPATTHLKDIGPILVYSGVNKESIVLEAGSGSGQLTIFLARFVKKVYSYEKNRKFYDLTKRNLYSLGIKNVELKNKDIGLCKERNFDLVVLDLLDSWNYVNISSKTLKRSGYLVVYLTNINQLTNLLKKLKGFLVERMISVNEQKWIKRKNVLRPENWSLTHTAFLLFARKI